VGASRGREKVFLYSFWRALVACGLVGTNELDVQQANELVKDSRVSCVHYTGTPVVDC
jgi:hypothetical protein